MAADMQSIGEDPSSDYKSLSQDVARVADTITACDRLCLLSARSLLQCIDKVGDGRITFIRSVSRDLKTNIAEQPEGHSTTTAQCVIALQSVVPVMGRFRLGTRDAKDLPFHPIDRSSMRAFDPDEIKAQARDIIGKCLLAPRAKQTTPEQVYREILDSEFFRYLHPFTASQVLRAIAPSNSVYGSVWWGSLFVVLWFLNRRGGLPHGYPNIQATNSPGTAFLTSKCVEAIEAVLQVFGRRRNRFKELIEALQRLQELGAIRDTLNQYEILKPSHNFTTRQLVVEIRQCVRDLALDGSFPVMYQQWNAALEKDDGDDTPPKGDFCSAVVKAFVNSKSSEIETLRRLANENLTHLADLVGHVEMIHNIIQFQLRFPDDPTPVIESTPTTISSDDFKRYRSALPDWLCSEDYWHSTEQAVQTDCLAKITDDERPHLEILKMHWHHHRDACASALKTLKVFKLYLDNILDEFGNNANADVDNFIKNFGEATKHISVLRLHLSKDKETGASGPMC